MSADRGQLFVGRLTKDVRTRDLEDVFSRYGRMTRCEIKYGTVTNYGFVDYEDVRDAEDAIRYENGRDMRGGRIVVEFSKGLNYRFRRDDGPRGGGFGGGGGGYGGGRGGGGGYGGSVSRYDDSRRRSRSPRRRSRSPVRYNRSRSRSPIPRRRSYSRSRSRSYSSPYSRDRSYYRYDRSRSRSYSPRYSRDRSYDDYDRRSRSMSGGRPNGDM